MISGTIEPMGTMLAGQNAERLRPVVRASRAPTFSPSDSTAPLAPSS